MADAKIRLYVDQPLGEGQVIALSEGQANYLFAVMRLSKGAAVLLFNGEAGEWRAEVLEAGKRKGLLVCTNQTAPLQMPPDLWLLFAPIKKARTDFIVEKATELGAARIMPVQTRFTNADRIRIDKLRAHAIEAAEQCGGTFVPQVDEVTPLAKLLASWPEDRKILWCNEHLAGVAEALPKGGTLGPWAVLIGPEGGFAEAEKAQLAAMPQVVQASLGPRILRADTAVVSALTLWQAHLGDWG
ncbi:16S rRNA (uracil(1498)-N(3))-methyltransferase [Pseudorhodobacter turbinis]|uniref:Ribosomal RNA small subunit methyltransferase E n=1 Tax=Pseudorhodobacter turbinis TaxID=2500533 RepID=A0A4P8EHG5_9RHOB|nr:16S rRNA (uracil(1498)-N(3))-methyltransferase [Pseudorhodobacter turbinis]QCO56347.1 16S rRNA (uracil(1498)-N(3))-methyltransferase [Pseudorhodobacter turbinis]